LVNDDGATMMMHRVMAPSIRIQQWLLDFAAKSIQNENNNKPPSIWPASISQLAWGSDAWLEGGPEYIQLPISGLVQWHTCATLWFISSNGIRAIRKLSDHVISSTMRNFICWHSLQNVSKAVEKHDSASKMV
jgi:hypothetical protein